MKCNIPCAVDAGHDRRIEYLKEPVFVNEINEVEKRPDAAWKVIGGGYGKVETRGGREVWKANQVTEEIVAIIETRWTPTAGEITGDNRIRVYAPDGTTTVFDVVYSENVGFSNTMMKFGCRATKG